MQANLDGLPVVQGANGTSYSVTCLRQNAANLSATGIQSCSVGTSGVSDLGRGQFNQVSNRGYTGGGSYYLVYLPYTYYNGWNTNYSTNYNAYNDTSYNSNQFCNWLFGGSYNYNCYSMLGYNATNYNYYSNYYNTSCSSCLYGYSASCTNTCYLNSQNPYASYPYVY